MSEYVFAGIDFVVSENGAYFIEANASPGALMEYEQLYGNTRPLELLAEYIGKKIREPVIALIYTRKKMKKYLDEILWKKGVFDQFMEAHVCTHDMLGNEFFTDIEGKKFKPNVILTSLLWVKALFEHRGDMLIVNPLPVSIVVADKYLSCLAVRESVRIPATYPVNHPAQAKHVMKLAKEKFKRGIVIKPRFGTGGKGIAIYKKIPEKVEVESGFIIQERIEPLPLEEFKGQYWDARVFVIDGKYMGGIARVSKKPVVNISLGGEARRLPEEISKMLKTPALKAVKAIERFASSFNSPEEK